MRVTTQSSILALLLALAGVAPVLAQTGKTPSWPDQVRRLADASGVVSRRGKTRARPLGRRTVVATLETTVVETEPNDIAGTADSVALGDRATGVVNPAGDVDTWFVDLDADVFLSVDVDAEASGSSLDPTIVLFAPDGRTVLAFSDDFDGLDSRISFHVPAGGRYYVAIGAFGGISGSPELRYEIAFEKVVCTTVGTEQEPNDSPATASRVAVGAAGSGEICSPVVSPAGDVDYWAFRAQAGTTIELDVDAEALGLPVDPVIALYASDGTTQLAFNDNFNGADSRLRHSISSTGTYFATVAASTGRNGNPFPYTLHVREITSGPGDPSTVRAVGIGFPVSLAVGSTGDLFVGDFTGARVLRVSGQGTVTTFAAGIPEPLGIAFDAFGHLLVVSTDGAVYRVTPQGQATRFITDAATPFWVAVAPDGRIWISSPFDRSLRRYTPTGEFEARFDAIAIGGSGPGTMSIGPTGEPYVSNSTEIWRLANGRFERFSTHGVVIWAFAFDVAGNVYVPSPVAGIKLFDPTGRPLVDPFAAGLGTPLAVAFGRDATGATLARLFVTDASVGALLEVNPTGVEHAGLPVGFVPPPFTAEVAAAGLLGAGVLSDANARYLDALGNHNGRYDVGDLQAYLKLLGDLPGAGAASPRPGSDR